MVAIALGPVLGAGVAVFGAVHRVSLCGQIGSCTVCSRLRIRSGLA